MSDHDELARLRSLAQARDAGEPAPSGLADVTALPSLLPSDNSPEIVMALGAAFRPQPFGYSVSPGEVAGNACVYLTIESAHGRQAFPFTREEAAELGKTLMRTSTGLILPGN